MPDLKELVYLGFFVGAGLSGFVVGMHMGCRPKMLSMLQVSRSSPVWLQKSDAATLDPKCGRSDF